MARKPRSKASDNGVGHNSGATDEVMVRAQDELDSKFHRHLQNLRGRRADTERAKSAMTAIRKLETQARNAAKADGFPLAMFDRILEDEVKTRADLERQAELERWMRQAAGLPVGGQMDLFADPAPRDEKWWNADGYQSGLRGLANELPERVPPEFHQAWLKGWSAGADKYAWAASEKGINPERAHTEPTAPVALEPEPEQEQAAPEFAEVGEEEEVIG